MYDEKIKILGKLNQTINKKINDLLSHIPSDIKIGGFIFHNFNDYNNIKSSTIINNNKNILLFYIPQSTYFKYSTDNAIDSITCISGCVEIYLNDSTIFIESKNKKFLNSNNFCGKIIQDTYLIASEISTLPQIQTAF